MLAYGHCRQSLSGVAGSWRSDAAGRSFVSLANPDGTASGRVSTVVANIALFGCESIPGNGANESPLLRGLDVDARGAISVAASGCGSVLKVTPDWKVTILVQLQSPWLPTAVALFGSDLYVLEYLHTASENRRQWLPRVRKISPDGKATIIATVDRR
jgi:hypothetical protein